MLELTPIKQLPQALKQKYNFDIGYNGLVYYRSLGLLPKGIKQGKNNLYDAEEVYDFIRIAKITGAIFLKDLPEVSKMMKKIRCDIKAMKKIGEIVGDFDPKEYDDEEVI